MRLRNRFYLQMMITHGLLKISRFLVSTDLRLEVQIVACDCAREHLTVVEELKLPGVQTAWGRLPGDLSEAVARLRCDDACGSRDKG